MAKIGIVTFHCSNNYGAVLQSYGLQEYIKKMGHEVYIINYTPEYKLKLYAKSSIRYWLSRNPYKCIKRLITEIRIRKIRIDRWNAFECFRKKYLNLYPYNENSDYKDFDVILLGSDQIWNTDLSGGFFDGIYWGEGIKCKVISYAASSRKQNYSEEEKNIIKSYLHELTAVSVREETFKDYLQSFCCQDISVVLDPSLLAGCEIYKRISKKPKQNNYLLVYEISRNMTTQEIAREISRENNLQIVELLNSPISPDSTLDQTASPEEFIGYIANASFVITTSFHGLAFSFMFQRDFYAIKQHTDADDRLNSFLKQVGLEERFITSVDEIKKEKIDYSIPLTRYNQKQRISHDFLKKSLTN